MDPFFFKLLLLWVFMTETGKELRQASHGKFSFIIFILGVYKVCICYKIENVSQCVMRNLPFV